MAQNIRRMIRAAVVSVWTMVKNLSYHIFFRKPIELHKHRGLQYHHLKTTYVYFFAFIIVPFYFVPWVGLAVWYIAIVKACEHQFTRDYVEAVCIQSQLGITNKSMPWYLDLWNSRADNSRYFDILSPSIEAIMTSHLPLYDAQIELLTHSSKLNGMLSASPVFGELLGSLGKSYSPGMPVSKGTIDLLIWQNQSSQWSPTLLPSRSPFLRRSAYKGILWSRHFAVSSKSTQWRSRRRTIRLYPWHRSSSSQRSTWLYSSIISSKYHGCLNPGSIASSQIWDPFQEKAIHCWVYRGIGYDRQKVPCQSPHLRFAEIDPWSSNQLSYPVWAFARAKDRWL